MLAKHVEAAARKGEVVLAGKRRADQAIATTLAPCPPPHGAAKTTAFELAEGFRAGGMCCIGRTVGLVLGMVRGPGKSS